MKEQIHHADTGGIWFIRSLAKLTSFKIINPSDQVHS